MMFRLLSGPLNHDNSSTQSIADNATGIARYPQFLKVDLQLVSFDVKNTKGEQKQTTVLKDFEEWLIKPLKVSCFSIIISKTYDLSTVSLNLPWNLQEMLKQVRWSLANQRRLQLHSMATYNNVQITPRPQMSNSFIKLEISSKLDLLLCIWLLAKLLN